MVLIRSTEIEWLSSSNSDRFECWDVYFAFLFLFYSVMWEPMGDGKKIISLADNNILLWDLQESSAKAVVRNFILIKHAILEYSVNNNIL